MSTPTVLVLAQAQDGTADLVVDALLARGADVARIDTADFPGSLSLAVTPDQLDSPGWLCVGERRIDLASVRSVYRRHPAQFVFPDGMSEPESSGSPPWSRSTASAVRSPPSPGGGSTRRERWPTPRTSPGSSGWPSSAG